MATETLCGTPGYVAPEVLNREKYGPKIDVWSLGVITYITLAAFPPFPLDMKASSVQKVKNAQFTYPSPVWDDISDAAKDFIDKMLVVKVEDRMSMKEVLEHPWFDGEGMAA